MKKNSKPLIVLMMLSLTAEVGYSALLDENFNSQTAGSVPTGATVVTPNTIAATSYIQVVGTTPMGTGNGLAIYDNDTRNLGLEYNFASASAIRVDMAFSPTAGGSATAFMTFGIGQFEASTSQRLSASARRYAEMRFYGDGDLRVYFNGAFFDYNDLLGGSTNTLTMFLNDYDAQSINYTIGATEYTLPANSVSFWVNDTLIMNGASQYGPLDLLDVSAGGTVGTSEGNLGRIGFSETSITGMDYFFDDLKVTEILIPEPSTLALALFGAAGVLSARRTRRGR